MPMTVFVATSMSGPPELPWLIAASVWIEPGIENPFGAAIVRLIALTIPALIDSEYFGLRESRSRRPSGPASPSTSRRA